MPGEVCGLIEEAVVMADRYDRLEAAAKAAEAAQQREIIARDTSIARAKQTLWRVEERVETRREAAWHALVDPLRIVEIGA